jgi:DNA-binding MarR family transcriptional regulator
MEALDLIVLGRQLAKIGEEAMRGSKKPLMATGPSLVLRDVFAHRDASINEIAERTGLPQSYVSESVAKLREQALVQTMIDPADKRRTLVRISDAHPRTVAGKGAVDVDAALAEALGCGDVDAARQVIDLLTMLCERLRPARPGPILEQLRQARHDMGQ